jgi:hypothetical protein
MFHDQKSRKKGAGEYGTFFVAKYISKLFELCFMTKKAERREHGVVVWLHNMVIP